MVMAYQPLFLSPLHTHGLNWFQTSYRTSKRGWGGISEERTVTFPRRFFAPPFLFACEDQRENQATANLHLSDPKEILKQSTPPHPTKNIIPENGL